MPCEKQREQGRHTPKGTRKASCGAVQLLPSNTLQSALGAPASPVVAAGMRHRRSVETAQGALCRHAEPAGKRPSDPQTGSIICMMRYYNEPEAHSSRRLTARRRSAPTTNNRGTRTTSRQLPTLPLPGADRLRKWQRHGQAWAAATREDPRPRLLPRFVIELSDNLGTALARSRQNRQVYGAAAGARATET